MIDTVVSAPAVAEPTHFALLLAKPFSIPGTDVVIPAGNVTVASSVVDMIPSENVSNKRPVEA